MPTPDGVLYTRRKAAEICHFSACHASRVTDFFTTAQRPHLAARSQVPRSPDFCPLGTRLATCTAGSTALSATGGQAPQGVPHTKPRNAAMAGGAYWQGSALDRFDPCLIGLHLGTRRQVPLTASALATCNRLGQ